MILRAPREGRPGVVPWWLAYSLICGAIYVVLVVIQVVELTLSAAGTSGEDIADFWFAIVFQLASAVVFGVGPFLRRGRATWIYGIFQLVLGMICSCGFCFPFALPLLIFWVRDDCRRWVEDRDPPVTDLAEVFD